MLRLAADPARCLLQGAVARRMHAAVAPFAAWHFITPMAAVAARSRKRFSARWFRRCGSSVPTSTMAATSRSIWLKATLHGGLIDRPDQHGLMRTIIVDADDPTRGVATAAATGAVSRSASPTP